MRKIPSRNKQLHVYWIGRVQGVGFRYTAESVALDLHLVGWVRNLPDGRVEAICEGPQKALKGFLDEVARGPMRGYIQNTEMSWGEPTGQFEDFRIRFY